MRRIARIVTAVVLAAALGAACGDDDGDSADTDTTTTQAGATNDNTTTTAASTGTGSGGTQTLIATDFAFDKGSVTAKSGQPVTFTLQNNGAITHNLTIDELDVDLDVEPNASATSDPATPAAGTYDYHCEFHPTTMKGRLIVS